MAVGSHENCVDVYSINKRKRIGICRGASSYITHVDWSADSKLIQLNSGAKERLFFEIPSCKRVALSAQTAAGVSWARWTSVLGPECLGIWPPYCDVTDVNATHATRDGSLLATGDDFGLVKLFAFPSTEKHAKCRKYGGHAARNLRSLLGRRATSGVHWGGDCSILFWRRPDTGSSNNEDADSDSDPEDTCYDSDVDAELNIDYVKQTNQNNQRDLTRQLVEEEKEDFKRRGAEETCLAKVDERETTGLSLHHVFGYRGYDARANADFFVPAEGASVSTSEVVYHAAGVVIIHCTKTSRQRLYTGHSDDVLCLSNNRHPSYPSTIASGQLGGHVHVWSSSTLEPLSLLSGLPGGVCSVSFSGSGRLLVAACLDSAHSLSVYRWQTGALVATKETGAKRVFQAQFRPDSDSKFVTVGERALTFWSVAGSVLQRRRRRFRPSWS